MKINNIYNIIKDAADERKTLEMIYLRSSDGLLPREVEPYEIRDEDFFAYDVKKQGIRRFKINLISEVSKTVNSFKPKWEIKIKDNSFVKYAEQN